MLILQIDVILSVGLRNIEAETQLTLWLNLSVDVTFEVAVSAGDPL